MATYSPSKITKDGNTYNFTDTTKIPLTGSNQISGDLIPSSDGTVKLGSNSRKFSHGYIENLSTTYLIGTVDHGVDINFTYGANLILRGKNYTDANEVGDFLLDANDGSNSMLLRGKPSGTLTWGSKNVAMQEDVIPRSGGAVMTGWRLARTNDNSEFLLCGGTDWDTGSFISLTGQNYVNSSVVTIGAGGQRMNLKPDGTWTWTGQAVQLVSDQRLKQQIAEIDDKLLDAWEDVEPSQFKYNDAVDQKKDKARLHTGYVVQQIDEACKSHNVDISKYGLYCHEEYPEETEEVEVEQEDGTKTKETKVIREASEHYSLRYTEVYAVECMYLRRCIARLTARIEELEKGNNRK